MAGIADIGLKLIKVLCDGACTGAIASFDILPGDKLADEIVKGIGSAAAKALVLEPTFGLFALWAAKKGFPLFQSLKSGEQRAALDLIAQMTPQQALEASKDVLREAKLTPAAKAAVEGYVL